MDRAIHIPLSKYEVLNALRKALNIEFIDNLRTRKPQIAIDSRLRGFVGEIAFEKWCKSYGVIFEKSNIKANSSGMDVDFVFVAKSGIKLNIELKTSLVPDVDQEISEVIRKRDIKLIRRGSKTIEQIESDLHVQIIFQQLRLKKDTWLSKQDIDFNAAIEIVYEQLAAYRYEKDCYLVGWIDKPTLIQQIKAKPTYLKKWKFGQREFWTCNISNDSKKPYQLIKYFNE